VSAVWLYLAFYLSDEEKVSAHDASLAVLKQLGNDGAALFTMFLAIMTVIPAIWPRALSAETGRRIVLGMVAFVVVFWLFAIAIPATTIKNYYGSTGYGSFFSHLLDSSHWSWVRVQAVVLDTNKERRGGNQGKSDDGYTNRVWLVLACKLHLLHLL
jgi:hypothetical protein